MTQEEKKDAVICTLFEKSYHLGLAVFVNSLDRHDFRGDVYAGYRGDLPPWAVELEHKNSNHDTYSVTKNIKIHFILLTTEEHLTNIKPDFMLDVWQNYCPEAEYMYYFDPDIVLKTNWKNMLTWANYGVALCEDINSPIPVNHPLRLQWKDYYSTFGMTVDYKDNIYVNGGFVGVNKSQIQFLYEWKNIQLKMKQRTGLTDKIGIADRWDMFHYTDQDALNITKDVYPTTSIMEKAAMDFGKIGYVMSHAAGIRKPWTTKYLPQVLFNSLPPTSTDKLFWWSTNTPIRAFSRSSIFRKKIAIRTASLLGRFVSRS